jgi:hypothetical protein
VESLSPRAVPAYLMERDSDAKKEERRLGKKAKENGGV